MVLYFIYTVKWRVLYSKQYCLLSTYVTDYKEQQRACTDGILPFYFAFSTSLLIQAITVGFVDKCGGDAAAWRTVAIIYAIIGLVVNTISALSVKELPEEELNEGEVKNDNESMEWYRHSSFLSKQILHDDLWNIYFTAVIWCHDWSWHLLHDMGTENKNLFGQFAWAVNIPLIIALILHRH